MTIENDNTSGGLSLLDVYDRLTLVLDAYEGLAHLIAESSGSATILNPSQIASLLDSVNQRLAVLKNDCS